MPDDFALLPAHALVARYRDGSLSPVQATAAALDRIVLGNEALNALCLVDGKAALAAAERSQKRWRRKRPLGPLDGVPVSVKDILLTKGWPTLKGSRTVDPNQTWDDDAPAVARLRDGGAVLLGKTTLPEYAWTAVTDSPLTGITRNPWDPNLTPGGSSGGSAVAVASFMGPLALGTDGGGSIRIPASFTGIFGLKPTLGRVPVWPRSPIGTLSHVGPMTRTVEDAALMLGVVAGPDPRDWHALPDRDVDYRRDLEAGVDGLRIAYSATLGTAEVEPEVAELTARAAEVMQELGATVEAADPELGRLRETFLDLMTTGLAGAIEGFSDPVREQMDPGLLKFAGRGGRVSLKDYLRALEARAAAGVVMNLFHETYDLLLTPTMPIVALAAGRAVPAGSGFEGWIDWTPFTYPFNLTGQPAASMPCGLTRSGLPVGLQVVGPLYGDALVLRACRAYEAACPFVMPETGGSAEGAGVR